VVLKVCLVALEIVLEAFLEQKVEGELNATKVGEVLPVEIKNDEEHVE
jgi:hypothetical protein